MLKNTIYFLARRYVAGQTIASAIKVARGLGEVGVATTLDHLGEGIDARGAGKKAVRHYLKLLRTVARTKSLDTQVAIKLSSLCTDLDDKVCWKNVSEIVGVANKLGLMITIDMEESSKTESTIKMFEKLRKSYTNVGVAIQAYLLRSSADINRLLPLDPVIRLVKGAYKEPADIAFVDKSDTDLNYIKIAKKLLKSNSMTHIATHDETIIRLLQNFMKKNNIAKDHVEFQFLYGVRRDLYTKLTNEGYNVRVYTPYGKEWLQYTVRRLRERPENLWFAISSLLK